MIAPIYKEKGHFLDCGNYREIQFMNMLCLFVILGGCPFNGQLSGTKYPTRAASPIKYNADQEPVKLKRLEP